MSRRVLDRIRQIGKYQRLASDPSSWLKLTVLGIARGHPFSSAGLLSCIGRKLFPVVAVRVRSIGGVAILSPADLGHLISFQEVILDQEYDLSLMPFTPQTIIDCGAHIGFFSLLAGLRFPNAQIIAFEPDPKNALFVRQHAALNRLSMQFEEAAVAEYAGESLFAGEASNAGALVPPGTRDSISVRAIDLPKFLAGLQCTDLLLKMDIEGREEILLPRCIPHLPARCGIYFETHGGEASWLKLSNALTEAGFSVRQLRQRYPWSDSFACRV